MAFTVTVSGGNGKPPIPVVYNTINNAAFAQVLANTITGLVSNGTFTPFYDGPSPTTPGGYVINQDGGPSDRRRSCCRARRRRRACWGAARRRRRCFPPPAA